MSQAQQATIGRAEKYGGPPRRSVAELLAATDDSSAWNELVDRYGRLVWSVARSFRLDDDTTADITQAAWLRLVEHRRGIRAPSQLASWLATTTRNEAISVIRSRRHESPTDVVPDVADRAVAAIDDAVVDADEDAIVRAEVRAAFALLPAASQQLLWLLTAEPKVEYSVIATIIGRPVGSIGPTRGRCLAELRNNLAEIRRSAR